MKRLNNILLILLAMGLTFGELACSKQKELKKPNILFCIADDATWMHWGAYGCDWVKTPNFDRVSENGILFSNVYTPTAKCAPSRAAILTGRNPWQLEEAANHNCYFPKKFKTIAETLDEYGYKVGYTGKGWAPGDPGTIDGKKRDLIVKAYNNHTLEPPTTGISNKDYATDFADFLSETEPDKPFFFWYGGHEPHRAYEYGSGIKKGGKATDQIDWVYKFWPDVDTVRTDMLDYAYEIQYFDEQLGKMLKLLEEKGELENTLILVTADNGMPFPRVKGHNYETANHLPLAVMWGDGIKNPGRIVDDYVSFIDFAATFADVSGVDVAQYGMYPIEGKSLRKVFNSQESGKIDPDRQMVILGRERNDVGRPNNEGYPIRGIVKDNYLYIRNFKPDRWPASNPETGYTDTDGSPTKSYILNLRRSGEDNNYWHLNFGKRPSEELFDIKKDPDCIENLAGNSEFQSIKNELAATMTEELTKQQDPRILGNGDTFDNYPPRGRGNFYEDFIKTGKSRAGWINQSDFERDTSLWRE